MKIQASLRAVAVGALAVCGLAAHAADWSDTYVGYRYSSKYAEPFNSEDISKNILNLSHVSGYKYGTNFFNVDFLLSDKKDPSYAGSSTGAQEIYAVYRNTLDFGKISGKDFKFGPFRGAGATTGFDLNAKADAGYNSKKRMFVFGPTLMADVNGFFNVSILELWESNAPYSTYSHTGVSRYSYKTHPELDMSWGIPVGPFQFEGYGDFIAAKGKDEFGGNTAAETHFDLQLMYDLSSAIGAGKNSFKVGLEYEYWKNKFGNNASGAAGKGAFAKTPELRLEYHF